MRVLNSYAKLPERFYSRVNTDHPANPELIAWNEGLADSLGLSQLACDKQHLLGIFSGQQPFPDGETIAMVYAGHQFGQFVPQLGDGRAALLAELVNQVDGRRYDVQLKGSGQTPYSRNGDGKSPLGPVIREYLLSEAMHRLGIPTTRSLAAVATGEQVMRDTLLPGGVLTRVAASHLRIGSFEYFAARSDREAIGLLVDYAIDRHYPKVTDQQGPALELFSRVVETQARLIAQWMALGFIHGVMNTDNMAISGETIDYGPCAFLDEFHIDKVFSSIDRLGRYAYGQQSYIAQWNLARLADCLLLFDGEKMEYEDHLGQFQPSFESHYFDLMASKLGVASKTSGKRELVTRWLQHLQVHQLDYTLSFRQLGDRLDGSGEVTFGDFEQHWLSKIDQQPGGREQAARLMAANNPLYIARNHQVERAIEAAYQGDLKIFNELHQVLSEPFTEHEGLNHYALPPERHERVTQTFCGT